MTKSFFRNGRSSHRERPRPSLVNSIIPRVRRLPLPGAEEDAAGQHAHQGQPSDQTEGSSSPGSAVHAGLLDADDLEAAASEQIVHAALVALLQDVLPREQKRVELIARAAGAEGQHHVRGHGFHHVHVARELVVLPLRQRTCWHHQHHAN